MFEPILVVLHSQLGNGLGYPSIRARLSKYLYANSGQLKIKVFPKTKRNFREQWSAPKCEWTENWVQYTPSDRTKEKIHLTDEGLENLFLILWEK